MKLIEEKGNVTLIEFPYNMADKYRVMIAEKEKNEIFYFPNESAAKAKFDKVA